jgi:hypothetical protein
MFIFYKFHIDLCLLIISLSIVYDPDHDGPLRMKGIKWPINDVLTFYQIPYASIKGGSEPCYWWWQTICAQQWISIGLWGTQVTFQKTKKSNWNPLLCTYRLSSPITWFGATLYRGIMNLIERQNVIYWSFDSLHPQSSVVVRIVWFWDLKVLMQSVYVHNNGFQLLFFVFWKVTWVPQRRTIWVLHLMTSKESLKIDSYNG